MNYLDLLRFFPVGALFFLPITLPAQQAPDFQFGEVTPETFSPAVYSIDSNANAVILFDHGVVDYDPDYNTQGFCYILEKHTRMRLLHKSGFDLASFTIPVSRRGTVSPTLEDFHGATYNLEDGKVVTTRLDKSNIFKDQNGEYSVEKVVFPNVREGSVIEYSFRIVYPGYQYIPTWVFQGRYPVLWSEYDITVPTLYDYAVRNQGHQKYVIDSTVYSETSFPVNFGSFAGTWTGQNVRRIWALQNVPALERPEPYTTTLKNHLCEIGFQLSGVHVSGYYDKKYRTNWDELTQELMKRETFGAPLTDRNRWLDDELRKITAGSPNSPGTLQKIFAYVRDHFDCPGYDGLYMTQPLKKIWEDKKGNVADVNLLMAALCRRAGMEAVPVILSSRPHGYAVEDYPLLSDYNYVITRVRVDGEDYLLDASKPYIGFGQLPEWCYNGWARVIDDSHARLPLFPDSVTENRLTTVRLANTDSGYTGTYRQTDGRFESMTIRGRVRRLGPEEFFGSLRKSMADYRRMGEYGFDSLDVPEARLGWHYQISYHFTSGTIYFNPIFLERFTTNPFSSPVRHYPVEMPYCINNTYVLKMDIPKGYRVDQLPASKRIRLQDGDSYFEYVMDADSTTINFRMQLTIRKTTYDVEEYPAIRDFFSLIVNKEKEPIVLKKIQL